jgi:hypothetical protein
MRATFHAYFNVLDLIFEEYNYEGSLNENVTPVIYIALLAVLGGDYEKLHRWDTTLYSQLKLNRCFGGTYQLYLQGRKISKAGR